MRKIFIFVCFILFLCCGCKNDSKNQDGVNSFPESYAYKTDKLDINLKINIVDEIEFYEGSAKAIVFDYDDISDVFIPNSEQVILDSSDTGGVISDDNNIKFFSWSIVNGSFSYMNSDSNIYYASVNENRNDPLYNLDLYLEEKTFGFATQEQALEDVKDTLEKCGVVIDESFVVNTYYLDDEKLKEQEYHMDMDGNIDYAEYKDDWSDDNDAYLFFIHHKYCNLIDYRHGYDYPSPAEESSAPIIIYYTKDGIVQMNVKQIFEYTRSDTKTNFLSFDRIMDSVITHFDNLLTNSKYNISNVKLCCDSEGDRNIVPVWAFWVTEKTEDGNEISYELRVNASTGGILSEY